LELEHENNKILNFLVLLFQEMIRNWG